LGRYSSHRQRFPWGETSNPSRRVEALPTSKKPDTNDYEHDPSGNPSVQTKTHDAGRIRELNDWLRDFAKQNNCVFLDYNHVLADQWGLLKKGYSSDGLHPNGAAYALMEPLLTEAIKAALRK
jgi:lysophospholipase L1-like esterase